LTHDDRVELTFDNIVNDSSLYASDVLNRIEKIDSFRKIESNPNTFSESECSNVYSLPVCVDTVCDIVYIKQTVTKYTTTVSLAFTVRSV